MCITLDVTLVPDYPDSEPIINLNNPRGLDDSLIEDIKKAAKEKCVECLGQPVVFELIEVCYYFLTAWTPCLGKCILKFNSKTRNL